MRETVGGGFLRDRLRKQRDLRTYGECRTGKEMGRGGQKKSPCGEGDFWGAGETCSSYLLPVCLLSSVMISSVTSLGAGMSVL